MHLGIIIIEKKEVEGGVSGCSLTYRYKGSPPGACEMPMYHRLIRGI